MAAVKETINAIPKDEWKPYIDRYGIKTDREIAVTVHSMNKTEAFTLIVLRWKEKTKQLSLFKYSEKQILLVRWEHRGQMKGE